MTTPSIVSESAAREASAQKSAQILTMMKYLIKNPEEAYVPLILYFPIIGQTSPTGAADYATFMTFLSLKNEKVKNIVYALALMQNESPDAFNKISAGAIMNYFHLSTRAATL